jgi:hypothetical protein
MTRDDPFWKPRNLTELLAELDRRERKHGPLGWVHYIHIDGRLYERTAEGLIEAKIPEGTP